MLDRILLVLIVLLLLTQQALSIYQNTLVHHSTQQTQARQSNQQARQEERDQHALRVQQSHQDTLRGIQSLFNRNDDHLQTLQQTLQQALSSTITTLPVELSSPDPNIVFDVVDEQASPHYIQAFVVINMKASQDRWERISQMLDHYFPDVPVFRLEAVVDNIKDLGILKSHLSAQKIAQLFSGPVCIMEDDFVFDASTEQVHQTFDQLIEDGLTDYDVLLLAPCLFHWAPINQSTHFLKVIKCTLASAYLVHPSYLSTLIKHYQTTLYTLETRDFQMSDSCDQSWHQLQGQSESKWICPADPIGNQVVGLTTFGDFASNTFCMSEDKRTGYLGNGRQWPILVSETFDWL